VVEACGIANAVYPNMNSKENLLSSAPNSNMTASFPIFRAKQSKTKAKGMSTSRIMGGMEFPNVFPWVVALMLDGLLQCGGSLISREWILTAGHCLTL
jgi:secreted trypsin-like serine protease